ncbi:MAG: thiamine pyrophosphate-dependent dehydrogenase E1 component subunit alpha [Dehalococcoidia bacterium]|nr:thiamine pyrophosphate-dependent dehydrogenase E1 component subunit alpha [Dehalococcoidia bacterium]
MTQDQLWERFYRSMLRVRRVEEKIIDVYWSDKIKSPVHLSIGQEAVATGVCEALAREDILFATYRSHHAYLAKGGDMNGMIAELYGKVTGCARGKGGSMHLIDPEHGVAGTSAVVGTTIANALGYAFAVKLRKEKKVVAVFFGDGAVDEGVFHESLNFAALKKLPVLFICENNQFAVHSDHLTRRTRDNLVERAGVYGVPAQRIEGNDVLAIYEQTAQAVESIRAGEGPQFLECMTYRWKEHVGPGDDFHLGYRTPEERQPWIDDDQLVRAEKQVGADLAETVKTEVEQEVTEAFEFAEESPFPDASELHAHVYAN